VLHLRADLARLKNLAGLGFTVGLEDLVTLRRLPQRYVVAMDEWVEDVVEEQRYQEDQATGTWRTGH
jgi:hypothetical protein